MTFRDAIAHGLFAILAVACGGSVFSQKNDEGSATGGNSSQAGSTVSAGKSSSAGSSASGGSISVGGSVAVGGSIATGGSVALGGSLGAAGALGVGGSAGIAGGPSCTVVDCVSRLCMDGEMPVTLPGQCCPGCFPSLQGCEDVRCTPQMSCPMGYTLGQAPGTCCKGCVPDPAGVSCPKIACGDVQCPLGYVRGDLVGGCCSDCLPDPLFCNTSSDCVLAEQPAACCVCPKAISARFYAEESCWSAIAQPRTVSGSCKPPGCVADCSLCMPPAAALCQNHHCMPGPIGAP